MAYTYTDLTVKLKIDPVWLADSATVFVAIQPQNGETENAGRQKPRGSTSSKTRFGE